MFVYRVSQRIMLKTLISLYFCYIAAFSVKVAVGGLKVQNFMSNYFV